MTVDRAWVALIAFVRQLTRQLSGPARAAPLGRLGRPWVVAGVVFEPTTFAL